MAVPISGLRAIDGALFYTNTRQYENCLLDLRTRMLDAVDHRTRETYKAAPRNYGNLDEEMFSEQDTNVITPNTLTTYNLRQGTPLFLEQMFASNTRYVTLAGSGSTATNIVLGTNANDNRTQLYVGQEIEINGEVRTVTGYTAATATTAGQATVAPGFTAAPPSGSVVYIKGREYVNPHLNESYRVTDKYGSYVVDNNRYQVDRDFGLIRYRPDSGQSTVNGLSAANSVWHPQNTRFVPYYFGKMVPVRNVPPAAGPSTDGVANNEELGNPVDPVLATAAPTVLTNFGLPAPDGEYSNIRITGAPGVTIQVELNGAILAISDGTNTNQVTIPFFDPDHTNDQLKANQSIDPDIYIQRFIKEGNNHLVIKAIRTSATATDNGIRVEGTFNGVDLSTGAIAATGRPQSSQSVETLDWSASRNSILGIVGKLDFDLGDRIALENSNDEIFKAQGVLESLTTIIAGTDINQFQSILSVIR